MRALQMYYINMLLKMAVDAYTLTIIIATFLIFVFSTGSIDEVYTAHVIIFMVAFAIAVLIRRNVKTDETSREVISFAFISLTSTAIAIMLSYFDVKQAQ